MAVIPDLTAINTVSPFWKIVRALDILVDALYPFLHDTDEASDFKALAPSFRRTLATTFPAVVGFTITVARKLEHDAVVREHQAIAAKVKRLPILGDQASDNYVGPCPCFRAIRESIEFGEDFANAISSAH